MKSQFHIDQDQKIVFASYTGKIEVDDVIAKTDAMLADPTYRSGMGAVCDYSNGAVEWSLTDVDRFRVYMSKISSRAGRSHWAIIFPKGKDTTTARIFVALHSAFENGVEIQLFRDQHSALKWVKEANQAPVTQPNSKATGK